MRWLNRAFLMVLGADDNRPRNCDQRSPGLPGRDHPVALQVAHHLRIQ